MTVPTGSTPALSPNVLAKLRRGVKHTNELMQFIADWTKDKTHLVHHTWADKLTYKIELRVDEPAPKEEWGAIFGDAIHNFRSALDVWMWETAEAQSTVPITPNDVFFPIAANGDAWRKWKGKMKDYIDEPTIEGLKNVQPYAFVDVRPLSQNALYGLHQLDIEDKHRLVHDISLTPQSISDIKFELDGQRGPGNDVHHVANGVSASHGGVIATLLFDKAPLSVELSEDFTWDAIFTTAAGVHHVHDTLTTFCDGVQRMIAVAEKKADTVRTTTASK